MVNALTLPPLPEEDAMSLSLDYAKKFFDFLKSLMMISLFSLLFLIFCYHFRELDDVYESLLSSAQTLSLDHFKVAAFGAEVDGFFSQQQIASQLETEGVDDPAAQDKVQEALRNLKQEEVDRLMYVGTLPNSCEFSRPSTKVKRYLDIDRQLSKKGLVEINPDPVAYKQVKKDGEDPENGSPISCYQMTLTDQGFNVKTALVKTLGTMFKSNANTPRLAMK
jgi:hypothetical protein